MHNGGDPILPEIRHYHLPFPAPFGYYLNVYYTRNLLNKIKPDLLHTHYASGYGTLGRLVNYHPYVLSVWGSDIYDFPYKSKYNMNVIKKNLLSADWICSTSKVMAIQTKKVCPEIKNITITPFGIDTDLFKPAKTKRNTFNIGTVKKISPKYGIDILIKSFARVLKIYPQLESMIDKKISLIIVGEGEKLNSMKQLASSLGIEKHIDFHGPVSHDKVPGILNQMDIFLALSRLDSESFGVAAIEASACELPVIVSDAGGLPEVIEDGTTGIVVKKEDIDSSANAIIRLIKNPELRKKMGKAGRKKVLKEYKWMENVSIMESLYNSICKPDE